MSKSVLPWLLLAALCLCLPAAPLRAGDVVFKQGCAIGYTLSGTGSPVVETALGLLAKDLQTVLDASLRPSRQAQLVIETLPDDSTDSLANHPQGFRIEARKGRILVTGADCQGTAYGIMELSRLLGVSPWVWWADSAPGKRAYWTVPEGLVTEQAPAVLWRGIFINDEDNGFCPWSWKTDSPSGTKGRIGPETHEKLFELLLRLRANLFWPAMHTCSVPFFLTEGNREAAERYGITIGTSHCEPMMRNTNGEWAKSGQGEYNFMTNREQVLDFWRKRVVETAGTGCFYTLGMRGIHDTGMLGVGDDMEEKKEALAAVIAAQRRLLAEHVDTDVTRLPQAFIPYKEVLSIYKAGLEVPDDVTLIWCDDNYGYMRHLPSAAERARSGGPLV